MAMNLSLGLGIGNGVAPSGPSYSAEATALFARFTTPPDTARKALIDAYIVSLKNAGVWTGLIGLHVYAAADAQAAQRNWVQDAYNASPTNAPTFTADRGYTSDGSTSYIDTGFPGNSGDSNWGQNNVTFGAYVNVGGVAAGCTIGQASTFNCFVVPRNSGGNAQGRIHSATAATIADTVGNRTGLASAYRAASGTSGVNRNGSDLGTAAATSTTMNASNLVVLKSNTTFSTDRVAMAYWGRAFTATEILAIYNATLTYLTAVGGN